MNEQRLKKQVKRIVKATLELHNELINDADAMTEISEPTKAKVASQLYSVKLFLDNVLGFTPEVKDEEKKED